MGNHEFIHEAKKKAMAGMTVTVCGFALMMLQGSMTASASTDEPTTLGTQQTTEVQLGAAAAPMKTATLQTRQAPASNSASAAVHTSSDGGRSGATSDVASNAVSNANSNSHSSASSSANSNANSSSQSSATSSASSLTADYNMSSVIGSTQSAAVTSEAVNGNSVIIDGTNTANFDNLPAHAAVYQYIFLMDGTTGSEISRYEVPNYTDRTFHATFDLSRSTANWRTDPLFVLFRYTSDRNGNGQPGTGYVQRQSQPFDLVRYTINTVGLRNEIRDNQGWFDNISFNTQGLHIVGWNALQWNNNDQARELSNANLVHHFIIIYGNNNQILGSVEVQGNSIVSRPDVSRIYPGYYGAQNSGFNVTIPLSTDHESDWNNDTLTAASVYTTATTVNAINSSNSVSYTSNSFTRFRATALPQGQEMGSLDVVSYADGKLHVSGWNSVAWPANEVDSSHLHHYLIVYDRTTNRQLASKEIQNVRRPDVARVYPNLYNAANSGFDTEFDIDSPAWVTDQLAIVSRYSTDASGNGDDGVADHKADWWSNGFYANRNNFGWLDGTSLDGTTLTVNGWHATSNSQSQPNEFIIVWDQTQGRQLAVVSVTNNDKVVRTDVGRQYTGVYNSDNSGFRVTFNATTNDWYNDQLQIVSRYSDQATGNGGAANAHYTDYWYNPIRLTSNRRFANEYYFDNVSLANGQLAVAGWHLTSMNDVLSHQLLLLRDDTTGQYVNLGNNQHSVDVSEGQQGYVLRNDLARPDTYGQYQDAAKSGFNILLANDNALHFGDHYTIISRRCASTNGDGTTGAYFDATTSFTYNQHDYSIDGINFGQNAPLHVYGWMASDASNEAPNAYVIILSNGHELGRAQVSPLDTRLDVESARPMIANSGQSGFDVTFDGQDGRPNINGNQHNLTVVLRFTNDHNGNNGSIHDDVVWQNYYDYNMTANAINRYILNNHIGHANITSHLILNSGANYYGNNGVPENGARPTIVIPQVANANNSLWGEISYEQQHSNSVFFHTVIDANNIVNIANTDHVAYGSGYPANGRAIQFVQINANNASDFAHELVNAAYYTAYVMRQYGMQQPSLAQANGTGTIWTLGNVESWMGGVDTQSAPEDTASYWSRKARQFFGTNYTTGDFLELVEYEMSQL